MTQTARPTTAIASVETVYTVAGDLRAAADKLFVAAEAAELYDTPLTWDTLDGAVQDALGALKEIQR